MYRLLYRSQAAEGVGASDTFEIIATSELNNPQQEITGFLLHESDRFLQYLEGPVLGVESLVARIETDRRHSDLEVIYRETAQERLFDDWSMKHLITFGERPALEQLQEILAGKDDGVRLLKEVRAFVSRR